MTFTTHRVIGLMEWPVELELAPEVAEFIQSDLLAQVNSTDCVVSIRIPRPEHSCSTPADLGQLRMDLEELFSAYAADER